MKSQLKIIITLFVIFISASFLYGQNPYFRHVTGLNELGDARINCLYQDQQGFIWLGTDKGAFSFDGMKVTEIKANNPNESVSVTSVYEDNTGKLWFGFKNGQILSLNKNDKIFDTISGQKPHSKITCITSLNNTHVIFGSYGEGLYILKDNNLKNINSSKGLSDDYIYTMVLDSRERIWLGTDNGINICDFTGDSLAITQLSIEDGLPDFIIPSLEIDAIGNIWIGTHNKGVGYFDRKTNEFILPPELENWNYSPVKDILALNDRIWIATENNGIIEYIFESKKVLNHQIFDDFSIDRAQSLLLDREGNIWINAINELFLSFGPKLEFFSKHDDKKIENIYALLVDSDDNIWFADDHGLCKLNHGVSNGGDQIKIYNLKFDLGSQKIMSLYEDPFGMIWIGTFGKGIIRLNPKNGQQVQITEQHGIANGNILSIKATDTDIWFATLGGASKCRISDKLANLNLVPEFENFREEEGLSNNFIYHICIDNKNRVWFATDGSGVSYYENGSFKNLSNEQDFSDKVVYSVTGDTYGNIWMNVANEGLYKFDGTTVSAYLDDPDHKNLSFSGIHASQDELVIAYDDGIDILNIDSEEIVHYEGNAGLSGNNPNLNTIDSDSQGNIWIGTAKGIVKYTSAQKHLWSKPETVIKEVAVYLEKINHSQTTSFSHFDNHFSFNYSGLWFQYPEKVEYLEKLDGHDLNWIKTKNNNVIYSNLKPGDYTFQVKAALYDNFENASIASYSFSIKKPYWTSFWFYLFLIIIIGLILFLYIKYRENKLKQKQAAIQENIKFQFENLKSQINPHFLFNSFSTLIALIESDQEEAIEYVDELSTLFRNILEYRDQDTISIEEELSIIDNYYQLQKKRYGGNLELQIDQDVRNESIKIPPMTLQLLIENAIKHNVVSKNKPLKIKVYLGEELFLFVENNLQLKNDEMKSTGIGIQNIIDRYKLITDKEIKITQTGDLFKVGLPIIR